MFKPSRILVPTDLSDHSFKAICPPCADGVQVPSSVGEIKNMRLPKNCKSSGD